MFSKPIVMSEKNVDDFDLLKVGETPSAQNQKNVHVILYKSLIFN